MLFLKERVGKLIDDIHGYIYKAEVKAGEYEMCQMNERVKNIEQLKALDADWRPFKEGELWGGDEAYFAFKTKVRVPESFKGETVVFQLLTGREGLWDATNPQFAVYVDGVLRQGFDVNHTEVMLTSKAEGGESFDIVLLAFTGTQNFSLKMDGKLKALDTRTEQYFYDINVPYQTARLLKSESREFIDIILALNESLNLVDLRKVYSEAYYASLEKARQYIQTEFYEKLCGGENIPTVYSVGHTHIDCAWLWTLSVTEDKAVRSFSTVLELMRQYPEYIFMSSQPQLYKYVKKNAPEIYEEIKERVKEGRWEVEGGMFVEADCNISSGEALVRQFMFGHRFFKEEFGKDNKILWLPDVFGYSAALPQILKKCHMPYFMTTKISWNELNKIPYDTFEWEGIDGSRVLTHFIPTRDYNKAAVEGGTETEHFTTYNGLMTPAQTKGGWERYSQKYLNNEVLCSFGWGDGGGGVTKEMLETQRRLAKGIPGCPKTKMSTAGEFFEVLDEHVRGNKYLPSWSGELYLEYHRGTYTSMARNKKYNRKSEFAAQNTELFLASDYMLLKKPYPSEQINENWEVILRNQFHDILPGSSIKEVYDDSKAEYEKVLSDCGEMTKKALGDIASYAAADGQAVIFNPNGCEGKGIVALDLKDGREYPDGLYLSDKNKVYPVQKAEDGSFICHVDGVPSKGYKVFDVEENTDGKAFDNLSGRVSASKECLENSLLKISFDEYGRMTSFFDKENEREILPEGSLGNVLQTYEDRPHNYDAWDINNYYTEKSWEIKEAERIEVTENGPVRSCLRIDKKYLDSVLTQWIYMYPDSRRIDMKYRVDWKENHILLKTWFPADVHTNEASFDIQYGNVKRPTHYNTSWDFARFEVCMHKWLDVSEDDYGLSVLNDCKYGCSVHDGQIGISLLKSATWPNPEADKEVHEFTLSLYPHAGDFKAAHTVDEAYRLNNPMQAVLCENGQKAGADTFSLTSLNKENVVIEVVKKAEKDDALIVRVYECFNRRSKVTQRFAWPIKKIAECDLLENEEKETAFDGCEAYYEIKPFEIKTFKVWF